MECSEPECSLPVYCKSLCKSHYEKMRRATRTKQCSTKYCDDIAHAKGLCQRCYYHEYTRTSEKPARTRRAKKEQEYTDQMRRDDIIERRRKRLASRGFLPCAF